MSVAESTGILAIWNNCADGAEATFEEWYQGEHLIERLAVPGFRLGRRYEGLGGYRSYFTYYETDGPEVLTSQTYLERVNDPTPLTKTVMDGIFVDSSRTVCRRTSKLGRMSGAYAVTAVASDVVQLAALEAGAEQLQTLDGVASVEIWAGVEGASDTGSGEQKIRGGDEVITGCLMVSVLRERDVQAVVRWIGRQGAASDGIGTYRLLCELRKN